MLRTTAGQFVVNAGLPKELQDHSRVLGKKELEKLLQRVAQEYPNDYRTIVQHLAKVGYHTAQLTGGNSFGGEHMRLSVAGRKAQIDLKAKVREIVSDPQLSTEEKDQKVIDLLSESGPALTDAVLKETLSEHNPLGTQVISGARGNPTNLRGLRAGDLLYVDHNNHPLPIPILNSYSQGLTPAEYYAGTFGARAGTLATKFCCSYDSLILMGDYRTKRICDITAGEVVMGANVKGETAPTTVKNVFKNGKRPCFTYRFRRGQCHDTFLSFTGTEDHKMLAQVKSGRSNGQSIYTPTPVPLKRATTYSNPEKNVFVAWGARGETGVPRVNEPKALLAGLFLGDGCMAPSAHGNYTFSCADPIMLQDFRTYLDPYGLSLTKQSVTNYNYRLNSRKVYAHPVKAWMKRTLGEKLAHEKTLPKECWSWDDESVCALVAGLFSTDGSINSREDGVDIKISLTAKEMVEDLLRLMTLRLGIWTTEIREIDRTDDPIAVHNLFEFQVSNAEMVLRFAKRIKLVGCKKLELAEALKNIRTASPRFEYPCKVYDKTSVGLVDTFDLEVDNKDHLFVLANGLIVSNSVQDAGYASKQFNQVNHRLVVTGMDDEEESPDKPLRGLPVETVDPDNEGALLAVPVGPYSRNTVLTPKILSDLREKGFQRIVVRSPTAGGPANGGVYARDAGVREKGGLAPTGDYVGIAAAQALSEPLTQSMLCLSIGTLIRMADGSDKAIEDVKVGDKVLGADCGAKTSPVTVLRTFDNGTRPCVTTTFRYGKGRGTRPELVQLVSTAEHKVLGFTFTGSDFDNVMRILPVGEKAESFTARAVGTNDEFDVGRRVSLVPAGDLPTFDIEVDNSDHLFVLANGLIVSNSSKHSGGVAGANKSVGGFALVNALFQVPKVFKGAASHAQVDGKVGNIREAPQGGHYVTINGKDHYVGHGFEVHVQPGQEVEAGDVISEGIPNPQEIVRHKGLGEGRRYFTNTFREAYRDSGIGAHRRNIELLARGLINHVELTDEHGAGVPGDMVPYHTVEADWVPRDGHKVVPVKDAKGYLERPVLHYSIGTKIKPSVIKTLNEFGIENVAVHPEPPPFQPVMIRGMENLAHDPDWMTRFLGSYLKKNVLKAVHRGATSDEKGTSYVPSLARALDFGEKGNPTTGYKSTTPVAPPPKPADSLMKQLEPEKHASVMPDRVRALLPHGSGYLMEKLMNPAFPSRYGKVRFPGGGVDPGETPGAALARELSEELGVTVDPTTLVPVGSVPHREWGHTEHYFLVPGHGLSPGQFKARKGGDTVVHLVEGIPGGSDFFGSDPTPLLQKAAAFIDSENPFATWVKTHSSGHHEVIYDSDDEFEDYPLRSITFHADKGHLLGYEGEDGEPLDAFQGEAKKGRSGAFVVTLPQSHLTETKFYRNLTAKEEDQVLRSYMPVLVDHLRFKSDAELATALKGFRKG